VRAIFDELLVNGVILVGFLTGQVVEQHQLGGAVAVVYHVALLGAGRHADTERTYGFDLVQCTQAVEQLLEVFFRVRILQPEEYMVHQLFFILSSFHKRRCVGCSCCSNNSSAGQKCTTILLFHVGCCWEGKQEKKVFGEIK